MVKNTNNKDKPGWPSQNNEVGIHVPSAQAFSPLGQIGSSVFNKGFGVVSSAVTSQLPTLVLKSQIWRLISKASPVEHSKLKTSPSTQKKYLEHSVVDQTWAGSLEIWKNKIKIKILFHVHFSHVWCIKEFVRSKTPDDYKLHIH